MNRMRTTVFTMLAVVTIIAAVFTSFFVTRRADRDVPSIVLPPEISGNINVGPDVDGGSSPAPQRVEIVADNLAEVILSLNRPAEYTAEYDIELFWDESTQRTSRHVWASGELRRVSVYDGEGDPSEHQIIAGDNTYIWREGERSYYQGTTGGFNPDDTAGIPTYEDLATVPADEISVCGYTELDGKPCVYAETTDAIGQLVKWWIALDDGLLWRCETWSGAQLAISRVVVSVDIGAVSAELFRLPDGNFATAEE